MSWAEVPLRRVFRIVNGGTPTSNEQFWNGDVPWATPVDLGSADGKYLASTQRNLTEEGVRTGSRAVPAGSLILSTRAPIGYISQATARMAFNQGCRGLVSSIPLDMRYFRYQLYALREELISRGAGSTFMELSTEALAAVPVVAPPFDEQRRIADFLDAETARIDALVNAISESSNLLKAKRRALLMLALPDHDGTAVRLGYYLDLVTSGPRGWGDYVGARGTPFFRSANLRRDEIEPNLEDLVLVDAPQSAAAETARSRVRAGDVLIGITGANTGWVSLADQRISQANVSQHVCLVRPGNMIVGPWLAYALSAPQVQELLLGSQYGGTKTQLSLGDIRDLVIPLPAVSEQHRIVATISEGLSAITTERGLRDRQITILNERKQALIAAAVTGGISV